jgi:hypothetical protein
VAQPEPVGHRLLGPSHRRPRGGKYLFPTTKPQSFAAAEAGQGGGQIGRTQRHASEPGEHRVVALDLAPACPVHRLRLQVEGGEAADGLAIEGVAAGQEPEPGPVVRSGLRQDFLRQHRSQPGEGRQHTVPGRLLQVGAEPVPIRPRRRGGRATRRI